MTITARRTILPVGTVATVQLPPTGLVGQRLLAVARFHFHAFSNVRAQQHTGWNVSTHRGRAQYSRARHVPWHNSMGRSRSSCCLSHPSIFIKHNELYVRKSEPQTGEGSAVQLNTQEHRGNLSGPTSHVAS